MIRIALCDDSELQLEMTRTMLNDFLETRNEEVSIRQFTSGEELIHAVKTGSPFNIYILDMIMPGMNGMELASLLRIMKDEGEIIFLTSSVEYAVQSYDVDASAYLLKPLDPGKLGRVLTKIFSKIETESDHILIKTTAASVRINPMDICYANIENRKVRYVLRDGRELTGQTVRKSFQEEVGQLSKYGMFEFCGLSLIINMKQVDAISDDSILIKNGDLLTPSHNSVRTFEQAWRKFTLRI